MIVKQRILDFEKLGFGMFVHFGLYSEIGQGEWILHNGPYPREDYYNHIHIFCPSPGWARNLAVTARKAGCRYITLTTRHHDGFSLYDTCGLNDLDAPHSAAGRDLVREFVDACREEGLVPFFYHTLLDWYMPSYRNDFPAYLRYLRASVEILCQNYGKIGGIWFDGMWDRPNDDWEEDALYSMIRSYQPEAMIINNTGLSHRGELGHIELDSVTFERGKPSSIKLEGSAKYIASEMCQVFATHWGYAKQDFLYKSLSEIIEDLCCCRRYGSNFLLNVGPRGDGSLRPLDEAMLLTLGEWVAIQKEALYLPRPAGIPVEGTAGDKDFLLAHNGVYYLFFHNVRISGDENVVLGEPGNPNDDCFAMEGKIRRITWLDSGKDVPFTQEGNRVTVRPEPIRYGSNLVVRVARLELE